MLTNTTSTASNEIKELSFARTILILGVVFIHCNPLAYVHPQFSNFIGCKIIEIFVSGICWASVPVFFAISGFLFFRNIGEWDWTVWESKLKHRVLSLFVPYILWNLLAALLFLIKSRYLGFNDFGIFADGKFHLLKFIAGFWNLQQNYPFDVPL